MYFVHYIGGRTSRPTSLSPSAQCDSLRRAGERRADDESLRRGTDVGKWVTGDQRQRGMAGRVEHPHVLGIDDVGALHAIHERSTLRHEPDLVVGFDVAQA